MPRNNPACPREQSPIPAPAGTQLLPCRPRRGTGRGCSTLEPQIRGVRNMRTAPHCSCERPGLFHGLAQKSVFPLGLAAEIGRCPSTRGAWPGARGCASVCDGVCSSCASAVTSEFCVSGSICCTGTESMGAVPALMP